MNSDEITKSDLLRFIEEQYEFLPITSKLYSIIEDSGTDNTQHKLLKFGKFQSIMQTSISFYKPICRIIDINKFEKEESI
jgi:hypothetical protein